MLISLEDIEDDAAKQAEIVFMEAFAARVHSGGLDAAWNPILPNLREALPDADPASTAAAAAIGSDGHSSGSTNSWRSMSPHCSTLGATGDIRTALPQNWRGTCQIRRAHYS